MGTTKRQLPRFLVEALPPMGGKPYVLQGKERHHVVDVLRLKPGDQVELFDGRGGLLTATLSSISKQEALLQTSSSSTSTSSSSSALSRVNYVLAVAMPKGNRSDLLVSKLTELGVDRIQPLLTSRAVLLPKELRVDRWQRIAQESSKQSLRLHVPLVSQPLSLAEFLQQCFQQQQQQQETTNRRKKKEEEESQHEERRKEEGVENRTGTTLLWGCMPGESLGGEANQWEGKSLFSYLAAHPHPPSSSIAMCIGPEGDFSPEEKQLLRRYGAVGLCLGNNRLRVETAAMAFAALTTIAWSSPSTFAPPHQ